ESRGWLWAGELAAPWGGGVGSLIAWITPAPNTGVGMRKMTFLAVTCASKFSCLMLQPVAPGPPVITNRPCTPPSGVPSGFLTKRASRTGPSARMNDGRTLPLYVFGMAAFGLTAWLVPPT